MDKLGASTTLSPPRAFVQCHVDSALVLLASAEDTERAVEALTGDNDAALRLRGDVRRLVHARRARAVALRPPRV